ncbi:MAG: glycosyltransferase family 4 protein [Gemmatimonadaceae bacterium]
MASNRRTILFVHGADEWYGSDYVLHELVRSLEGTEFVPLVLVPDDVNSELSPEQRLSGRLRAQGVAVHAMPLTVLRRRYMTPLGVARLTIAAPSAVRAALRVIQSRDVAVVHSHTATVLTGASVARTIGAPHLWHVSEIVERPQFVRKALTRKVVRAADKVVAVSHAVRNHLLATEPGATARIDVIHNGIDPARFANDASMDEPNSVLPRGGTVGMLGRIGTWKGQELLLDAARIVCRELPDTRFVLAGGLLDGNTAALETLRALARDYGIADRVTIREYCDDVPTFLRELDVFVQPSLRPDPLPTTILEAMASGKPVVATAHGGASEMVDDQVTGLLTAPGDATALASAIARLLRDPATRARMGAAGRDRVRRDFSPAAFSAAYLRAYRELAAAPRRPGR